MYEVSEFVFLCKLIKLKFEFFFFFFFDANKKNHYYYTPLKLQQITFLMQISLKKVDLVLLNIIINLKRDNLMSKDQLHDSSRLLIHAVCIRDSHIKSKKWNFLKG